VHIGAWSAPVLVLLDMMDMLEQVYGGGYLREVDHVMYWWKVLALAN
jgi:hypothetical protein